MIELDVRGRAGGKTHDLIQWQANHHLRCVVVPNHVQLGFIKKEGEIMGIKVNAMTFDDFLSLYGMDQRMEYAIDNLELCLQGAFPHRNIVKVTWSDSNYAKVDADAPPPPPPEVAPFEVKPELLSPDVRSYDPTHGDPGRVAPPEHGDEGQVCWTARPNGNLTTIPHPARTPNASGRSCE